MLEVQASTLSELYNFARGIEIQRLNAPAVPPEVLDLQQTVQQQQQLNAGGSVADVICVEIPLLYDNRSSKLHWLFGLTVTVACSAKTQLRRLRARNPELTEQQCQDRQDHNESIERCDRLLNAGESI